MEAKAQGLQMDVSIILILSILRLACLGSICPSHREPLLLRYGYRLLSCGGANSEMQSLMSNTVVGSRALMEELSYAATDAARDRMMKESILLSLDTARSDLSY
jgi:hypothetical protein